MTLLATIRSKGKQVQRHGVWFVLRKFIRDHIVAHKRHVFLQRDLALPHKEYSRRRNWTIRVLESERDLELFRTHFTKQIADIRKLFDQGVIGSAVFVDDVLVGYMWYARGRYYDVDYAHRFELNDDEVYQFAGLLVPQYRGTLMVLDGMQFGHRYLHESGYRRTICVVDLDLPTNLTLHFKLGFEEMGKVLHVWRLFFLRWSKMEPYQGELCAEFKRGSKATTNMAAAKTDTA